MVPFDQLLAELIELARTNDPKSLVFVDRIVNDYSSLREHSRADVHPCDDLAEAFMKTAPETELKTDILDKLFLIGQTSLI